MPSPRSSSHSFLRPASRLRFARLAGGALFALLAACDGSDDSGSSADGTDAASSDVDGGAIDPTEDGGNGSTDASSQGDASQTADAGEDADAGIDAGPPPNERCPAQKHATVVFVGDSITAGAGQAPFYRTLLTKNDDTKYPAWKGKDLPTCWQLEGKAIINVSKGGAVATVPSNNDPTDMGVLLNQVKKVPNDLEGPVLVIGTIGGNDGQLALANYLLRQTPFADSTKSFLAGLGQALADVTAPNRFGAGVKADVYLTNVYDPTGGTGTFKYVPSGEKCSSTIGNAPPNLPITGLFTLFNSGMTTEAAKYPGVKILDLFGAFRGHGIDRPAADTWFVADCIHPNAKGHETVRSLFWGALP